MKRGSQHCERHALDLLEEAVHLLRLSPLSVLATYYLGSLPFVLGSLFFWTDMSQSAFARERIAPSALLLGASFLWMKCFQTIFAQRLLAQVSGDPAEAWNRPRLLRVAAGQMILQPLGLFLLPVAAALTLPLGWVYAFFQNATVLGSSAPDPKQLRQEAWRQARIWPGQNHLMLAFLSLGALFVLLNLGLVCFMIPQFLKMLFGIESVFTRHPLGLLNSTFLAAVLGLSYLCLDPLVKAVYVLRCFYGRAIESGEDLKAELRILPMWRPLEQKANQLAG